MATTYLLMIDGVFGNSKRVGYEGWFDIDSFSLGQSKDSGSVDIQDLSVAFKTDSNSGLTDLLMGVSTGTPFRALQIEGVEMGPKGGLDQTVYKLILNDVFVSSVLDDTLEVVAGFFATTQPGVNLNILESKFNATFDFGKIGIVTPGIKPGTENNYGWDVGADKPLDPATLVSPTIPKSPDGATEPLDYYLLIDGIAGSSTDVGREGWFELEGFSLGQSQVSGRVNIEDLSVTLFGGKAGAILPDLYQGVSTGTPFRALQIEGVIRDPSLGLNQTVYKLTLNDVLISSVSEDAASEGGASINATFDFGKIGLVMNRLNQDGSLGADQTYGWDVGANGTIDPATLVSPLDLPSVGRLGARDYYLLIDGIAGDSTREGYEGWFELNAFSLGQSQVSGRVNIQDLSVSLSGNSGLADLLRGVSTGTPLRALQIEGVNPGSNSPWAYKLTLNDIIVSSVSEDAAGGEKNINATFDFGKIGLVMKNQSVLLDVSLGAEHTYGWDVLANKPLGPATLVSPTMPNSPVVVESPTAYYLFIQGIVGDSTRKGYEGWFELDAFSLGQSQVSGSVNFQDLSVSLSGTAGLTDLLRVVSDPYSQRIEALQIYGVIESPEEGRGQAVYKLTLNEVFVSSLSEDTAGSEKNINATFDFGRIGLTTNSLNPDGSFGVEQTYGWDVGANKPDSISDNTTRYSPVIVASPTNYYLKIAGIKGDLTYEGREGWFDLDAFSFGQSIEGLGRVDIQDLSVSLSGIAGLTGLLQGASNGAKFTSLQIEGETPTIFTQVPKEGGGTTTKTTLGKTVYKLTLNEVFVSSVSGDTAGSEKNINATFDFGKIGLVTNSLNQDGSLGAEQTYAWDVGNNTTLDPATLTTSADDNVFRAPSPTKYYLKIDRIAGDSTDVGREGWFDLDTFSLGQSGAADGGMRPMAKLSLDLLSNVGLTYLLKAVSTGTPIFALQIEGVIGGNPKAAYSLRLNDITVVSVSQDAEGGEKNSNATLIASKILLELNELSSFGNVYDEYGWDFGTNEPLGSIYFANSFNSAPVISSDGGGAAATVSVIENQTIVTRVMATDAEPGFPLTYAIVGGVDASAFAIDQTSGLLTFKAAPDFEAPTDSDGNNVYQVVVQSSDGELKDSQTLNVNVRNSLAPVISSDGGGATATVSVMENQTIVTRVMATDPDAGTALTYAIAGGVDASAFIIDQTSGLLTFKVAPDFEAPTDSDGNNVYQVIVQSSDGEESDNQTLNVNVGNNLAPVISSDGGGATATVSVMENQTIVTRVMATDPDAGTALTYAIAGGVDASAFIIDQTSGLLTFKVAPDFEAPTDSDGNNVYQVIVQSSDGEESDNQTLNVNVGNVAGATITGTEIGDVINSTRTAAGQPLPTGEDDVITGNGGNDALRGGADADTLSGGDGADMVQYNGSAAGVRVNLNVDGLGFQSASGGDADGDVLSGFENAVGSDYADALIGDDANNVLIGGAGADTLTGNGGNDALRGGADADTLSGGDGADMVQYNGSAAGVRVNLNVDGLGFQSASGGDADGDVLSGFENAVGSDYADALIGDDANNVLIGGAGADTLTGNGGN
ncbi:type VI secretion system tube protein Hcp, partial [Sulfitobacter sp.]|uniref:type VI secretion system tube protein Hcp n=1 Tax=Sulfitobacter sp. TaxID=1903071 RepID=UPI00300153D7